ncbi:MAG TPA: hypothetical protein VLE73_04500 [Candidatus Saccharimonadales bacterium]|nr:hypothetical protein [Candidatus Saccharimonadales bacterium]
MLPQEVCEELSHNLAGLSQQLALHNAQDYPLRELSQCVPFDTEPLAFLLDEKIEEAERDAYLEAMGSIATWRVGVSEEKPSDTHWVGLYAKYDETIAAALGLNRGLIIEERRCDSADEPDVSVRLFAEMFSRVDGELRSQEILLLDAQVVGDPNPEQGTSTPTAEQALAVNALVTVARGILTSVSEDDVQ